MCNHIPIIIWKIMTKITARVTKAHFCSRWEKYIFTMSLYIVLNWYLFCDLWPNRLTQLHQEAQSELNKTRDDLHSALNKINQLQENERKLNQEWDRTSPYSVYIHGCHSGENLPLHYHFRLCLEQHAPASYIIVKTCMTLSGKMCFKFK